MAIYLIQLLLDLALLLGHQLELFGIGLRELPACLFSCPLLGTQGLAGFAVHSYLLFQNLQLHLQELLRVEKPLFVLTLISFIWVVRQEG